MASATMIDCLTSWPSSTRIHTSPLAVGVTAGFPEAPLDPIDWRIASAIFCASTVNLMWRVVLPSITGRSTSTTFATLERSRA